MIPLHTLVGSGTSRLWCTIAISMMLSGCAVEWTRKHELYCRMDEQTQLRDTLYFGRLIPGGGEVGDADWNAFQHDVLASAFPGGFTVLEAKGTWRGADGATISEPSRVVAIVHADDVASDAAVRAIIQRYRTTFHQEAVLRERAIVCASF